MKKLLSRRPGVSSIARLDGWRAIIERLANPRLFNCVTPSMPANGKLGKLEQRRIGLNYFSERHNPGPLGAAIGKAGELPTVIVSIMRDVENRLVAGKYLVCNNHGAIARLIEWPRRLHHLTRKR